MDIKELKKQIEIIKSKPDSRDFSLKSVVSTKPKKLPSNVDLSLNLPFLLNQKSKPFCVGFGIVNGMNGDLNQNNILPKQGLSPEYLYTKCKIEEGNTEAGTQIRLGLKIAQKNGVCLWNTAPFDVNREGLLEITEVMNSEATDYRLKTYARLYSNEEIKQALNAGKFVVVGTIVTKNNWFDGDEYIINPEGMWLGAHCSLLIGYDDNKEFENYKGFFKGVNTWGEEWGEDGYYWMSYDFTNKKLPDFGNMPCLFESWAIEMEGDIVRKELKMDTIPILDSNNRTLVPVRFIAEALGGEVYWNEIEPDKVEIIKDNIKIEMWIGKKEYIITTIE